MFMCQVKFNTKSAHVPPQLQTVLVEELTVVYRGLACHREAVIRDAVRDKCLRRAEEHFTAATRLH